MVKKYFNVWIILFFLFFAGQKAGAQDIVPDKQEIIRTDSIPVDITDSIGAIKITGDSIPAVPKDTTNETLNAPVYLTAKDSMIMVMDGGNLLYLYGQSTAKYENFTLESEIIRLDADSSKLYATFGLDSVGAKFGYPSFKDGDQEMEMEQLWYNFKTKKMYTHNLITQQGEGFITADIAKKLPDNSFYIKNGRYTTCDNHDDPHFYFELTRAKFRPGKNTVTGPVYLVVEDVPLPIAAPFFFFPSTKSYSSGILMPSYGDEMARGFNLHDGGYYFAFNDYVDLALTGQIYTKGSWGLTAQSNYRKQYKFSGNFNASYLVTILGDKDSKDLPNSDYSKSRDMKVTWSHTQDAKANPFGTFTASVNFSTSSYSRNDYSSYTMNQITDNTKSSSVSYSYRSPTLPLSISTSASINQISKDSTLSVSFPDMTISVSTIYPFKRKEKIGDDRWYEKIYFSYTGTVKNSITNVKESQFLHQSLIKDWKNGIKHSIPISASFNLMKYITISTSANYNENWYSNHPTFGYDYQRQAIVPIDTVYGFFRAYSYSGNVSMNTKLYGTYQPWSLLGKWTRGITIRHMMTPTVSFSGAPDFSDPKYGMYTNIRVPSNNTIVRQALYQNQLFGGPSAGRTGAVNFSLDNNLEMKLPVTAESDSSRKVSLIDNLGLAMSYNFLADSLNWSNLNANLRLKLFKSNINLSGQFDTYCYGPNGQHINVPRWKSGKGIGRFMGTSTSYSKSFNNESLKKLFRKGGSDSGSSDESGSPPTDQEGGDNTDGTTDENSSDTGGNATAHKSLLGSKKQEGNYDSDGYLIFTIPWNLSINYTISLLYDTQNFNKQTLEYPYKISQTMGFNGDISPTKAWKFTFSASYDFNVKRIANMFCTLTRQMHCWSMSATIVPFGPTQNYSFTIAVNSSLLQDVKYQQSSGSRDAMGWGNY